MRYFLAFVAGLAGAFVGAALLSMAGAALLTAIYGGFEGAAAMGGGVLGPFAGALLGFGFGMWLVLWRDGKYARPAFTVISLAFILVVGGIVFVVYS